MAKVRAILLMARELETSNPCERGGFGGVVGSAVGRFVPHPSSARPLGRAERRRERTRARPAVKRLA